MILRACLWSEGAAGGALPRLRREQTTTARIRKRIVGMDATTLYTISGYHALEIYFNLQYQIPKSRGSKARPDHDGISRGHLRPEVLSFMPAPQLKLWVIAGSRGRVEPVEDPR